MSFFIYYFNYSVSNTQTQEFNLENSNILDFGVYSVKTNQINQNNNQSKQSYCDDRFHPSFSKRRLKKVQGNKKNLRKYTSYIMINIWETICGLNLLYPRRGDNSQ